MKSFITIILTALLSFTLCLFLPWWSIAIAAFIVATCIPQSSLKAFLTGFIALFILWSLEVYCIDSANQHLLSSKIAELFKWKNSGMMLLFTGLIGGLVAGCASVCGYYAGRIIQKVL